jgi:hemerythrin
LRTQIDFPILEKGAKTMQYEIEWDDKYSVSIDSIDSEHQKLIGLINRLVGAMSKGQGKTVVEKILSDLMDYTVYHFGREEEYFAKFAYADAAGHIEQHKMFIMKIQQFTDDFEDGRIGLSVEILQFLSRWLIDHISTVDRQYSDFLVSNGVK